MLCSNSSLLSLFCHPYASSVTHTASFRPFGGNGTNYIGLGKTCIAWNSCFAFSFNFVGKTSGPHFFTAISLSSVGKKVSLVGELLTSPLDFPKLIYKGRKVLFISQMIRSDLSSKTFRVFLFHLVSKERKFRKKSPKIRAIPNLANPVPISPA